MTEQKNSFYKNSARTKNTLHKVSRFILLVSIVFGLTLFALSRLTETDATTTPLTDKVTAESSITTTPTVPLAKSYFTTQVAPNEVLVSFDTQEIMLKPDSEYKVNIMLNSGSSKVVGAGITVMIPNSVKFELDKSRDQNKNADPECKALPGMMQMSAENGKVTFSKVSMNSENLLPTGLFCLGTLFFKTPSTLTAESASIVFGGSTTNTRDWDIVSATGRLTVSLGSPLVLTAETQPTPPSVSCELHPKGDANCDGKYTKDDFDIYLVEYFAFNENVTDITKIRTDFNGDKKVNSEDFAILQSSFDYASAPKSTPTSTVGQ